VNNAGVGCVGTAMQTLPADFDRLMQVNVRGTFLVTRAFLPAMLAAGRGSVINLASIAGSSRCGSALPTPRPSLPLWA